MQMLDLPKLKRYNIQYYVFSPDVLAYVLNNLKIYVSIRKAIKDYEIFLLNKYLLLILELCIRGSSQFFPIGVWSETTFLS